MWQVHFSSSGRGSVSSSSMRHKQHAAIWRQMSTSCLFFLLTVTSMILIQFTNAAPSTFKQPKTTTDISTITTALKKTTTTNTLQKQQQPQQQQPSARVQQCREGCFEKFATKEILCQQNSECLTCWDECAKPPPPKINKSIRETWTLHTVSMLSQDSLVLVDVAWSPQSSTPNQCLVTWEVAGGGLMGNLLTESFNVQLSLWPDTKYRVQVTCKNKFTGSMTRSLPLTIDTADSDNALDMQPQKKPQTAIKKQQALINTNRLTKQPVVSKALDAGSFDVTNANMAAANFNIRPRNDDVNVRQPQSPQKEERSEENEVDEEIHNSNNNNNNNAELPPPPYEDDQSSESLNQHTNFIFNWHARNSDISAIEPLQKPDLNLFTIATLAEMQKPLLYGVIAGTFVLAFILLMYVCMLRQHRLPADKAALIDENCEAQSVIVSMPPAATNARILQKTQDGKCRDSATCSRNALKV